MNGVATPAAGQLEGARGSQQEGSRGCRRSIWAPDTGPPGKRGLEGGAGRGPPLSCKRTWPDSRRPGEDRQGPGLCSAGTDLFLPPAAPGPGVAARDGRGRDRTSSSSSASEPVLVTPARPHDSGRSSWNQCPAFLYLLLCHMPGAGVPSELLPQLSPSSCHSHP